MRLSVQDDTDHSVLSTAKIDLDRLRRWHSDYVALDTWYQAPDSTPVSVLADIYSDHVDAVHIEERISQAALVTHVPGRFCNRCLHLFSHWPNLINSWEYTVQRPCHTAQIEAAARQGCHFCAFLLTRLTRAGLLDTFYGIERRLDDLKENSDTSIAVQNWGISWESQILWLNFPGRTTDNCNSWWALRGTLLESNVAPPSFYFKPLGNFVNIASDWLNTCSKHHNRCFPQGQLERPTRLICIADDAIKLVITVGWQEMPLYATLSYCWGTEDFLKLTPKTLNGFLDVIPSGDLPKIFRDAIYIARKLGLQYIWIDALCIVQDLDDNRDWLGESGIMRSIYGGGHVNIAAASAPDVHSGCFYMPATCHGGFSARVETTIFGGVQTFHSIDVYEESTIVNHLASRAWACQERLLAPRTIYFGDQGLFWECRSIIRSEFLPHGFPGRRDSHIVQPQHQAWNWSDIVGLYSGTKLTNGTDKLPALSGIARRQHEVNGDEYLAGMWKRRFVQQLGWMSNGGYTRPAWRAPSWSWASVDGQIWYWDQREHQTLVKDDFVQVIKATTSTTGPDPFGPISSAELRLACTAMVRGYYDVACHEDNAGTELYKLNKVMIGAAEYHYPVSMDCSVDDFLEPDDPVYLLPLFGGTFGSSTQLLIYGMILQRACRTRGHFQRIGAFHFSTDTHDEMECLNNDVLAFPRMDPRQYNEFLRVMEETGASTAESVCAQVRVDAESSEAKYIIFID